MKLDLWDNPLRKGYRKPHSRKTSTGRVVQVSGTTTKGTAKPQAPTGKGRAVPTTKPASHKPSPVPPKPAGKGRAVPENKQAGVEYASRLNELHNALGYHDGANHFLNRLAAAVNMGQSPRFIRNLAASLVKRLVLADKGLAGATPPAGRQAEHQARRKSLTAALDGARKLLQEADAGAAVEVDTWHTMLYAIAKDVDEAKSPAMYRGNAPF